MMAARFRSHPALPYVAPFVSFMVLLALIPELDLGPRATAVLWVVVLAGVLVVVGLPDVPIRLERPWATVGVGIAVFVIWILPDQISPAWRQSRLFDNWFMTELHSTVPESARSDPLVVALRFARATVIVPIVEELFWRGWLPRWLEHWGDFRSAPLGHYTRFAFWATAVLFALEHGPFWDVGLIAGIIYNFWMAKTKSLGDLICCHTVTNACLSLWVLHSGQWLYW